jgi:hypothetical protein
MSSSAGGIRCAAVSAVRAAGGGHPGENRDEQLDPVENVRQHPADQREQDSGQSVSGLHEGDEYSRMRTTDQQPLGTHGLHPGAHVADQHRDPQRPEQPDAQRRPRRRSRYRVSHARFSSLWATPSGLTRPASAGMTNPVHEPARPQR